MSEFIKYKILINSIVKSISRLIQNILRLKIKIRRQKIVSYIYQKRKRKKQNKYNVYFTRSSNDSFWINEMKLILKIFEGIS